MTREGNGMKKVGTSIAIFGGLVFVSGIVFVPILDSLVIDPIAFILLCIGLRIRREERMPIKWPAIFCGWYVAVGTALLACTILVPEKIKIGKYNLVKGWPTVITIVILLILVMWSVGNLLGLLKNKQRAITEPIDIKG
jgi:hypothetical protein